VKCQGQVRLAPRGGLLGFDLSAALAMGHALGYRAPALAELLPEIEAGLVEAVAATPAPDEDAEL
jgi:hypothetical protein